VNAAPFVGLAVQRLAASLTAAEHDAGQWVPAHRAPLSLGVRLETRSHPVNVSGSMMPARERRSPAVVLAQPGNTRRGEDVVDGREAPRLA